MSRSTANQPKRELTHNLVGDGNTVVTAALNVVSKSHRPLAIVDLLLEKSPDSAIGGGISVLVAWRSELARTGGGDTC